MISSNADVYAVSGGSLARQSLTQWDFPPRSFSLFSAHPLTSICPWLYGRNPYQDTQKLLFLHPNQKRCGEARGIPQRFVGKPSVHNPFLIFQVLPQILCLARRLCKALSHHPVLQPVWSSSKQVQFCLHNHILSWWRSASHFCFNVWQADFNFSGNCDHAQNYVLKRGGSILPVMDELFPEETILQVQVFSLLA